MVRRLLSARRFLSDLALAQEKGYVAETMAPAPRLCGAPRRAANRPLSQARFLSPHSAVSDPQDECPVDLLFSQQKRWWADTAPSRRPTNRHAATRSAVVPGLRACPSSRSHASKYPSACQSP